MTIAGVIKNLRLTLGMEQREFGKLFEVTKGTVCSWEHGRRTPRLPKLKKMIDVAKEHKVKLSMRDFLEEGIL